MIDSLFEKMKKLNTLCATLSGVVLLFVTLSIFVDVFLRYFFNKPSIWVTEVSTYLFLYIIFFAAAYTLQQGMHIRVTFIFDLFGPGTRRALEYLRIRKNFNRLALHARSITIRFPEDSNPSVIRTGGLPVRIETLFKEDR